jgi:hypothetical protein
MASELGENAKFSTKKKVFVCGGGEGSPVPLSSLFEGMDAVHGPSSSSLPFLGSFLVQEAFFCPAAARPVRLDPATVRRYDHLSRRLYAPARGPLVGWLRFFPFFSPSADPASPTGVCGVDNRLHVVLVVTCAHFKVQFLIPGPRPILAYFVGPASRSVPPGLPRRPLVYSRGASTESWCHLGVFRDLLWWTICGKAILRIDS